MIALSVSVFNRSKIYKNYIQKDEILQSMGTEYVDQYIRYIEDRENIIINDHEAYLQNEIKRYNTTSVIWFGLGLTTSFIAADEVLAILKSIAVITKQGYRIWNLKDAIPVFADYDRPNYKLNVMVKDLTGKEQKLFDFNATPKNLASLGRIIRWEEYETQEEQQ